MGQPFGGGQAAIDVAVAAVPLLTVIGAALYLNGQHRRYGRPTGWSGTLTRAALLVGAGLVAYAVWPLPASIDGLCPVVPEAAPPPDPRSIALTLGLFLPVGILARARFRRGLLVTLALGTALALAVTAIRATGVLGLYPCSYNVDAPELTGVAVAGVLLGWLLARWVPTLWPYGPHRSWPGAVPDQAAPDLLRRALGTLLDLGAWWFGSQLVLALIAVYGPVPSDLEARARIAVLSGVALLLGVLVPMLRRDRCSPGRAAVHLALTERSMSRPAGRHLVLARTALLSLPVVLLIASGHGWWALAVVAVHASAAVVRPDGTGLVDLLCGVRVRTRSTIDGALPGRLVRYSPPETRAPASV
ncbi:antibiotic resistance protein VanZ [Nocardiopsis alba]|uniref:antibiotic resistance protein VanZ n=1 Tax=Nocardiopsis alba TaxID=53437 RepID=UPI00339E5F85